MRSTRIWTKEENDALRQMAESGRSKFAMAARFNRNTHAIDRQARILGLTIKKQRSPRNIPNAPAEAAPRE